MREASIILYGIVLAFVAFIVFGPTFGSRCRHAYPNSGLEQERCVDRLARGERL